MGKISKHEKTKRKGPPYVALARGTKGEKETGL
jgi:hypothetical protein